MVKIKTLFTAWLIVFFTIYTSAQLAAPQFSVNSGFYQAPFSLTISHPDPQATIIYTLDGSEPDENNLAGTTYTYKNQYPEFPLDPIGPLLSNAYSSMVYNAPIAITDRSGEPNKVSAISSTYNFLPYYIPSFSVSKNTVVRAKAIKPGFTGKTRTANYFVSGNGFHSTDLPVIALNTTEEKLFGYENGIYVAGKDFDLWRTGFPSILADGFASANYNRSGNAWEIKTNINYFVNQTEVLNQDVGIRIHGGQSRIAPNKSLRLYAKTEYGTSAMNYAFFDNAYNSFKRLILRNSGGDTYLTMLRDGFIQRLTKHLRFQTQSYQPSVMYLNGEYWGIFNIQERYDDKYFERVFDIDEDDLDYLEADGFVVEYGENTHYMFMLDFMANNPLTVDENYEYVATMMDIDNYIDFYLTNIYIGNTDWPHNNIEFWRKRTAFNPDAPYGHDGRWRWVLKDTDFGFGGSNVPFAEYHNTLAYATAPLGYENTQWPNFLFRNLLTNEKFKNKFISRFADMINTTFLPERVNALLYQMKDQIAPEMGHHTDRWSQIGSIENWNRNVDLIAQYANNRPDIQRNHIRQEFGIEENIPVTLEVKEELSGYIKINSIDIKPGTAGVNEIAYPWSGVYFKNIPITLSAIPFEGYEFSGWTGSISSTEAQIEINPTQALNLTAHFVAVSLATEDFAASSFQLHPNPVTDKLNVKHHFKNATYDLLTVDGKLLQRGALTSSIDLSSFSSGIYILKISGDGKISTKKLIKS